MSRLAAPILALVVAISLSGCRELHDLRRIKAQQDRRIGELQGEAQRGSDKYTSLARKSQAEAAAFKERLEVTESELRKALARRSEREVALEREKTNIQEELTKARKELTSGRKALDTLGTDLEARAAEATSLEESLAKTRKKLEQETGSRQALAGQVKTAQKEGEDLRASVTALESDLEKKRAEAIRATTDLNAANKRIAKLEKEISALETLASEAEENLLQAGAKSDEELAALRAEKKRLEAKKSKPPVLDESLRTTLGRLESSLQPVSDAGDAMVLSDARGVVVRLSADYLFLTDVIDLDPNVITTLDHIAAILAQCPGKFVEIQGHTDTATVMNLPFADNWALGASRAEKVLRYLVDEGSLDPKRVKSSSCAEFRPLKGATAEQTIRLLRRVEIIIGPNP